jgi:AcrR family transcriptional regulator
MTGSKGPRGPYAGTAQRRASILEMAWQVFATQGYRGGSLREISARLGFSQAGMLHHFGSKENLMLEVLRYRDGLNSPSEDSLGIRMLDHLRTVVKRNSETPGAVRLFVTMSAEATDLDHPAHQFFVDRYSRLLEMLRSEFILARLDGEVHGDLDPDIAARQLVAFLDGIQLQWLITPVFDMVVAYDQYVKEFRTLHRVHTTTAG